MSAYALPGLFPPIETMSLSCSKSSNTTVDSSDTSENSSSDRKIPLHLHDQGGNYVNKCDNSARNNRDDDDFTNSSNSSNIGCIFNSAAIAVKEAKIDPIRWIQYVTGSSPQLYAHHIGKTLRRRVSTTSNNCTKGKRTRSDCSSGSINKSSYSNGASSSCSINESQQNEAIEFELSITFDGRKYTAKRTMQCIMQLRDDLIREMKRRKQWLTQKQELLTSTSGKILHETSTIHKYDGHLRLAQPSYFEVSQSSCDKLTTTHEQDINHSYSIQIPEIPPLTSDHDRRDTGFVGKGFTMLHAMVKSYVPVMETWLKNVMEIVPQDSECLMNFLWEPKSELQSDCFKSVLDSVNKTDHYKLSTSLANLGSIKEMDDDTEYSDSENVSDEFSPGRWKE